MVSDSAIRTADISVTNVPTGRTISHAARGGSGRHPRPGSPLDPRERSNFREQNVNSSLEVPFQV